jgi:hypothetical protein
MAISRILLASGTITLASVYLYARYYHQSLASQVSHQAVDTTGRKRARENGELETLPTDLLENPQIFRIIHDRDEKTLDDAQIFDHNNVEELFTKLVRRNMTCFAKLPQSWMLSMMAKTPEQKVSFKQSHLLGIDYVEGDLFCGFYRVIKRDALKVEINMEPPPGAGPLRGRLVVSLNRRGGEAFLRTETLQWVEADAKVALPLERAPIRFMHEMASWWLLVSGAAFIQPCARAGESSSEKCRAK